jgi:hypothetical protein
MTQPIDTHIVVGAVGVRIALAFTDQDGSAVPITSATLSIRRPNTHTVRGLVCTLDTDGLDGKAHYDSRVDTFPVAGDYLVQGIGLTDAGLAPAEPVAIRVKAGL